MTTTSCDERVGDHCIALKGGLGNQLFQLAFALWLTDSSVQKFTLNRDYLDLHPELSHGGEMLTSLLPLMNLSFERSPGGSASYEGRVYVNLDQVPYLYLPALQGFCKNTYYEGFFLNWNYVKPHLSYIRNALSATPTDVLAEEFIESVREPNQGIVGVHIRRGSIKSAADLKWKGLVEVARVAEAVRSLLGKVLSSNRFKSLKILLFSDDDQIDFELPHIRIKHKQLSGNQRTILDFCILRRCDFIIAGNSSYSVWASFLSETSKLSLYPGQFFRSVDATVSKLMLPPMSMFYDSGIT